MLHNQMMSADGVQGFPVVMVFNKVSPGGIYQDR